jgi:cell wall-active antibiotic response 4TMS protein YvqF
MMGPLLLIVIGVLFLLNNLYPGMFRFGRMWPVILIVIGAVKVIEYFQGEKGHNRKEGQ